MKPFNFGPATVTHGGVDIGKTHGGGSLTFKKIVETPISNDFGPKEYIVGGEGTLHLFRLNSSSISASDNAESYLYTYNETVFDMPFGVIRLYRNKIYWPESLTFGVNSQKSFDTKIKFTGDSNNRVISMRRK